MTPTLQVPTIDAADTITELLATRAALEAEILRLVIFLSVMGTLLSGLIALGLWLNFTYQARYGGTVPRWICYFDTLRFAHPTNILIQRVGLLGWHLYGYAKGR